MGKIMKANLTITEFDPMGQNVHGKEHGENHACGMYGCQPIESTSEDSGIVHYKCSKCGKEIDITEDDKNFPYADGWYEVLDHQMVVSGSHSIWLCPQCSLLASPVHETEGLLSDEQIKDGYRKWCVEHWDYRQEDADEMANDYDISYDKSVAKAQKALDDARIKKLEEQVKELEKQIDEYNHQQTLNYCVHCGAVFQTDDEDGTQVKQHIQTCEKHPLNIERKAHKAEIKKLFDILEALQSLPCDNMPEYMSITISKSRWQALRKELEK